jgi:Leucine-rich repeat (LRR) protein
LSDDAIVGLSFELPWELGLLTHLTTIQLDFNQRTGTLPTHLGQPVALKSLDINFNLTGKIPTELGQLVSLTSLDLNSNQLTGTIPSELAGIGDLTYALFFNNALTGSLEQSFCAENRTWDFLVVDCAEVECSCCDCY